MTPVTHIIILSMPGAIPRSACNNLYVGDYRIPVTDPSIKTGPLPAPLCPYCVNAIAHDTNHANPHRIADRDPA